MTRAPDIEPNGDADDATLVARAVRDPRAFAPLYRRYVDPIYRYCALRLGSRAAAEDATSQVFTKALAALPNHRHASGGSFRSWLFAIAHNVVADHHRARRPTDAFDLALHVADAAPAPEEVAVANDTRDRVRALLTRLPADQRRILELRLAGLSGAEVAAVLGRSPGAVKIAQVRAYARLRSLLAEEPAPDPHPNAAPSPDPSATPSRRAEDPDLFASPSRRADPDPSVAPSRHAREEAPHAR
jgi:RNA polymerase sigma-70 factor (ECF subfamily)